jgi:hypothetical protein
MAMKSQRATSAMVEGALVIQNFVEEIALLEEQENEIKILQPSEIDTKIEKVLRQFFYDLKQ